MKRLVRAATVLALLVGGAGLGTGAGAVEAAPAPDDAAPTAVETLLFETDHLAGITEPALLEYHFTWTGAAAFSDRVVLHVGAPPARRVEPDFLSGAHHVAFPAMPDAHGNPLLLYFLESDLREMQRQTGGQPDYFRRLIRRALARPDLALQKLAVTVDGRQVPAQRVTVAPFTGDPNAAARYSALKEKTYEFVLSSAVPGQVVSLATRVTDDKGASQEQRLVWSRISSPAPADRAAVDASINQESR